MSDGTHIEWTNATWNPLRASYREPDYFSTDQGVGEPGEVHIGWHCERVSPGCQNCYAERLNERRFGTGLPYNRKSRDLVTSFLDEATLTAPLHWWKPRRIFVCSMTDLFGEWVPDDWIDRVFAVMASSPRHTFQVLTKRPERMREYLTDPETEGRIWRLIAPYTTVGTDEWVRRRIALNEYWPLPNVWVGASVEDQVRADERIPELLGCPAAVRFLSCEPLLGPVDLHEYVWKHHEVEMAGRPGAWAEKGDIDWCIVGGESGPGARPCDLAWIRSIVGQCQAAGTSVFVKQLGSRVLGPDNPPALRRWLMDYGGEWVPPIIGPRATIRPENAIGWVSSSLKGGDMAEWPEDLRVREWPV